VYAAVDKRVSVAYRDRLIKCYGLDYENFNVCHRLDVAPAPDSRVCCASLYLASVWALLQMCCLAGCQVMYCPVLNFIHGLLCFAWPLAVTGLGVCPIQLLPHTHMSPASPVCHSAFAEHVRVRTLYSCMHVLPMQV